MQVLCMFVWVDCWERNVVKFECVGARGKKVERSERWKAKDWKAAGQGQCDCCGSVVGANDPDKF
jgi:hypothetical protein